MTVDIATPPATIVDALVDLLSRIEGHGEDEFYDHVCETLCRDTSFQRAGLLLYDPTRRITRAVGSYGLDRELLAGVEATLEETPVARRSLEEDRVIEVSENLEAEIPARYAQFAGITTIVCAPVAAAGRWFGVLLADRGGGRFEVSPEERGVIHLLGRLSALAATIERGIRQDERTRRLDDRITLTREIHEQAVQRLFGLSLVLDTEYPLSDEERARCVKELSSALSELRVALGRHLAPEELETETTLRSMLGRQTEARSLDISWEDDLEVPAHLEPLAQSVAIEALRNVDKHAPGQPTALELAIEERTLRLEITNDRVDTAPRAGARERIGLGLKLLTLEALRENALIEFGPHEQGQWRVRLLAPLEP